MPVIRVIIGWALSGAMGIASTGAATSEASDGEIAVVRFTERGSGAEVGLDRWAGQIVVLDFFAYWCAPCERASKEIGRAFGAGSTERQNGHGVPVTVVAINVERSHPARTEAFIRRAGLEGVVDDLDGVTLAALGARSLPFLVVVDGTQKVAGQTSWRVVYRHNGWESLDAVRTAIESVGEVISEDGKTKKEASR